MGIFFQKLFTTSNRILVVGPPALHPALVLLSLLRRRSSIFGLFAEVLEWTCHFSFAKHKAPGHHWSLTQRGC